MEDKDKKKKEVRCIAVKELRVEPPREEKSGGIGTLEGYAAIFNSWSEQLGFFREKIQKGAFKKALKKSDCRALINHDSSKILGRQSAGTLRLKEDDKGLFMSVDLPDTQYANDLKISVARGDITQQSFQFEVEKDAWVEDHTTGEAERTILEVRELFDVSPVTFPAYPDTTVAKRSLEDHKHRSVDHKTLDDEMDNFEMQLIKESLNA